MDNADMKNRGLILATLLIAVFMAVLDSSIVNVSLPRMMQVFGVNTDEIQWVVTAYALVVGTIIHITGYLTERFGYKRIFMIALFLFTLGSLLCGLAWSNPVMVLFRIVQAIGGGALMPVVQALIFRMFPREKRGQAMGIFGIAIMFAPRHRTNIKRLYHGVFKLAPDLLHQCPDRCGCSVSGCGCHAGNGALYRAKI
ncbi:MFS transporter [Thermoactinomyces sp. CICC 10521]|nr:MFS transporter [Thermoactinomyces sp. CICC 10521]MBH8607590.1 MFS transporter [Thermoactinomyces sp. CICC 10521]